MADSSELFYSQAALSTFQICPLRFRFRYLDELYWSSLWGTDPDERAAAERGQNFHLLARRYFAGVDPALPAFSPEAPAEFARWLAALRAFLPPPGAAAPPCEAAAFYPELELRLDRPELRLQARFDLLVVSPDGQATIYDWKTESRAPRRSYLQHTLQTVLYRFLLCAAGGAYSPRGAFAPEQVSMVYWFAQHPERPERFPYNRARFHQDEQLLRSLMAQIRQTSRDQFLATTEVERVCRACEYQPICHGRVSEHVELDEDEWLQESTLAWDDLPELP